MLPDKPQGVTDAAELLLVGLPFVDGGHGVLSRQSGPVAGAELVKELNWVSWVGGISSERWLISRRPSRLPGRESTTRVRPTSSTWTPKSSLSSLRKTSSRIVLKRKINVKQLHHLFCLSGNLGVTIFGLKVTNRLVPLCQVLRGDVFGQKALGIIRLGPELCSGLRNLG